MNKERMQEIRVSKAKEYIELKKQLKPRALLSLLISFLIGFLAHYLVVLIFG